MPRRRRRVKIKSSSRLFAFVLFNLLLLATCITAHYLQEQSEADEQLPIVQLSLKPAPVQHQTAAAAAAAAAATQGISSTASSGSDHQRPASILSSSQFNSFQDGHDSGAEGEPDEPAESEDSAQLLTAHRHHLSQRQHEQQLDGPEPGEGGGGGGLLSVSQMCLQLPVSAARHLKLCKLVVRSPSADEALASGAARGLAECRNQFKSERWNCTHAAGDHHLLTSRLAQSVGNRESAFVQAIAAAGIVHSIATACSSGSLSDCACDKSRVGLIMRNEGVWKWGGCSNNIRHGMLFARHLVELLDAVHEQARQQQHLEQHAHLLHKRALSSRHREPNQLRGRSSNQLESALLAPPAELLQQQQQMLNFCQKNQNISQGTQIQLIKSLLSRNSLERHQDFRLAVNKHNNRVGLNAVARNMELKCRCHGLSGSCSLKTCWNRLPDFEQIGAYLKRKYDNSVHLPSAVNVNRLIPMMDRQELSAILLQNNQEREHQAAAQSNQVGPQFAALTSGEPPASTVPPHFNYYERHKQLEQMAASSTAKPAQAAPSISLQADGSSQLFLHADETPISIAPMSQQQYQALLRDMKLCNSNASQPRKAAHTLQQRLHQPHHLQRRHLHKEALHSSVVQQQQQQHAHHKRHSGRQHARKLHHGEQQLQARHSAGHRLDQQHLIGQLLASPARDELVHLHKSPDYCEADLRHGFAGVQSRVCSPEPLASNSCDKLCCGRGFEARETQIRYNCDCKFQYCCKIHCNYCERTLVEHVCK